MTRSFPARAVAWALVPLLLLGSSPWSNAQQAPPPQAAPPATPPDPFAGQFGDDLFGIRPAAAECGFTLNGSITQFYQGVTSGGLQDTFRYGGRVDLLIHIDGEKAGLWKGFFIDLHDETLFGQSINSFTGALLPNSMAQAVPIPDGPVNALTGVKFTQALSENFVLFGGKINTLDGFNPPLNGGYGRDGFWNGNFLFPLTLAKTIPYSSLGGGFAVLVDMQPIFAFTVLDSNNTPTTTGFQSFFDSGVDLMLQATLPINPFGLPGHHSFIGAYTTHSSTDLSSVPYLLLQNLIPSLGNPIVSTKPNSWALAYMWDQMLVHSSVDPKKGWGVFGASSITDGNPNPLKWSAMIGLGGTSPIPTREALDSFGVAYSYNGLSTTFKDSSLLVPLRDTQAVEVFYNIGVTPWCHITPDFQVGTPVRAGVETYTAFGLRAQINF
jgi:porin